MPALFFENKFIEAYKKTQLSSTFAIPSNRSLTFSH